VPYVDAVPRPQTAEQVPQLFWAQYLQNIEVERRIHEILKMYKGGYTQVQ
jgi:hypothetical protein